MTMSRTALFLLAALLLTPLMAHADGTTITRLTITGEAGEYISQGQTKVYVPNDGVFQLEHPYQGNGIRLWFHNATRTLEWNVEIGGSDNASPQVGDYLGAMNFSVADPGKPRLSISGMGRGCNALTGSFTVKQVVYNPDGAVLLLWVTFTQYCDNSTKALSGELIFQVDSETPALPTSWGQLKMYYR